MNAQIRLNDANILRRRQLKRGHKGHLDEVFLRMNGRLHDLGRVVSQDGYTHDIHVQSRRDRKAAKRFFRTLLKRLHGVPGVMVTDTLKIYGAARWDALSGVEHRQHQRLNLRADLAHQSFRQQERPMRRVKSLTQVEQFVSTHFPIANLLRICCCHASACEFRVARCKALPVWEEVATSLV